MKTYTIIAGVGTILFYLIISFFKWQLNPGLWGKELRFDFIIILLGWWAIAAIIKAGMEDLKTNKIK
jgi:hypothetical protein